MLLRAYNESGGSIHMKWKNDIDENVRSGIVELLILKLLSEEKMYGYQIKQELSKRTGGVFVIKEGSLYGPLYRMFERKLISSEKILVGEKRFRNYYCIEEAGHEYLEYGLAELSKVYRGVHELLNFHAEEQDENADDKEPEGDFLRDSEKL